MRCVPNTTRMSWMMTMTVRVSDLPCIIWWFCFIFWHPTYMRHGRPSRWGCQNSYSHLTWWYICILSHYTHAKRTTIITIMPGTSPKVCRASDSRWFHVCRGSELCVVSCMKRVRIRAGTRICNGESIFWHLTYVKQSIFWLFGGYD